MTIYNIMGIFYVLDRDRLLITRDHNRTRAINNAIAKCWLYDKIIRP